ESDVVVAPPAPVVPAPAVLAPAAPVPLVDLPPVPPLPPFAVLPPDVVPPFARPASPTPAPPLAIAPPAELAPPEPEGSAAEPPSREAFSFDEHATVTQKATATNRPEARGMIMKGLISWRGRDRRCRRWADSSSARSP